ncbi:hypothetical protein LXL04_016039 [Taraxacum kok-saghyz]
MTEQEVKISSKLERLQLQRKVKRNSMRQTALNSSSNSFCCYICTYYCDQEKEEDKSTPSNCQSFTSNWGDLLNHLRDPDIRKTIKRKCGSGEETSFWSDPWIGDQLLKDKYPRLFSMEMEKQCTVADRFRNQELIWNWRTENLRGRLEDQRNQMEQEISGTRLNAERDRWIIPDAPNLEFSVSWLREKSRSLEATDTEWPDVWSPWTPKRKIILAWRAIRGRVPAKTTLVEMGIDVQDDQIEDVSHVFLKCPWAVSLWTRVALWWDNLIPAFDSVRDIFEWIDSSHEKEIYKEVLKVTSTAILNIIWDHRNGIIFDKKDSSSDLAFVKLQVEVPISAYINTITKKYKHTIANTSTEAYTDKLRLGPRTRSVVCAFDNVRRTRTTDSVRPFASDSVRPKKSQTEKLASDVGLGPESEMTSGKEVDGAASTVRDVVRVCYLELGEAMTSKTKSVSSGGEL